MKYSFEIPGPPVGKARPRVTKNVTYTPQKTKDYEELVRQSYDGPDFEDRPLRVSILAMFDIPKSYSKALKATLPGKPCSKKPDFDNIAKIITDALNGTAYQDDKQITEAFVRKIYRPDGIEPRVIVMFEEVNEWEI